MNALKFHLAAVLCALSMIPAMAQGIQLTPADIVTPPDGLASRAYSLSVSGVSSSFFFTEHYSDYGQYSELLFGDNDTVYFHDIMVDVGGWTKGIIHDNRITVDLPALQYWYEGLDYGVCLAAVKCIQNSDGTWNCDIVDSIKTAVFTIGGDGTISYESPGEDIGIGLYYTDGCGFVGFADLSQTRVPFNEKPYIMPDTGVSKWSIRESENFMCAIDMAVADDEVFMRGIFSAMPDAVIKGTLSPDKRTISLGTKQYLGIYANYLSSSNIAYLILGRAVGSTITWLPDDGHMDLSADFEKGIITGVEREYLLGNIWNTEPRYFEYINNFAFRRCKEELMTPDSPAQLEFTPGFEEYGYNQLNFSLPNISVDGNMLDAGCYTYSIFIDGEPYTFESCRYEELQQAGIDALKRIPYGFSTGWEINADLDHRSIILYENGFSRIGVQGYYTYNGETRETPLVEIQVNSGISQIVPEQCWKEYFTIDGRRIEECGSGITICRTIYPDGTMMTKKICK